MLAAEIARAWRARRDARRRRGAHAPLQGARFLEGGSRHQHPPHRIRGQAHRPVRLLRHHRGHQPLPRDPRRAAARRGWALLRGLLRLSRSTRFRRATPRGSTRRRSPARSRTSPASTIRTRRPKSARSGRPHRQGVQGGEPRQDPRQARGARLRPARGPCRRAGRAGAPRGSSCRTAVSSSTAGSAARRKRASPRRPSRSTAIMLDERARRSRDASRSARSRRSRASWAPRITCASSARCGSRTASSGRCRSRWRSRRRRPSRSASGPRWRCGWPMGGSSPCSR